MASSDSDSREQQIDNAIAEFLQADQAGTTFDALAWLDRNKRLQPELSNFLQDRSRFCAALRDVADTGDDAADGFVAGEVFDGLQIVSLLKRGGMGQVYLGWQLGLERPVAIKTLRTKENPQLTLEGFQEEGRKLAKLRHENIVTVYGTGQARGWPYIIMELLPANLRDWLNAGPLTVKNTIPLMLALCRAVSHAAANQFLHLDIKPSNVLLDIQGVPKLCDFGLALRLSQKDHLADWRAGTTEYMAPEQFRGQTAMLSERTDVYGLGALLYECLSGKPPLPSTAQQWTQPLPLRKVLPRISKGLESICQRCLAEDPEVRFANAGHLASALEQFHSSPVRRTFLAASVGVIVTATVGGAVWFRQHTKAQRKLQIDQLVVAIRDAAKQRSPGWSWTNRDLLLQLKTLDESGEHTTFLRTEWSRCLVTPDLRLVAKHTPGKRYTSAEFRPGTTGRILAMAVHLRDGDINEFNPLLVQLYDIQTKQILHTWKLTPDLEWEIRRKREDDVRGLAFTPDGQWLFIGTRSGGIYVVKPDERIAAKLLVQDTHTVCEMFPTSDSKSVLTVSLDGTVRRFDLVDSLWKETAKASYATDWPPHYDPHAAVHPDTGDLIVLAHDGNTDHDSIMSRFNNRLELLQKSKIPIFSTQFHFVEHGEAVLFSTWENLTWQNASSLYREELVTPVFPVIPLDKSYQMRGWRAPDQHLMFQDTCYPNSTMHLSVWDHLRDKKLIEVIGNDCCRDVAFASDARIVAMTMGAECYVMEMTDTSLLSIIAQHSLPIRSIGLSADGELLWTIIGRELHCWHCVNGKWLGQCVGVCREQDGTRFGTLQPRSLRDVWINTKEHVFVVARDRPPQHYLKQDFMEFMAGDPDSEEFATWKEGHLTCHLGREPIGSLIFPSLRHWKTDLSAWALSKSRLYIATEHGGFASVKAGRNPVIHSSIDQHAVKASCIVFDPDSEDAILGDLSGSVHLFTWPELEPIKSLSCHAGSITGISPLRAGLFAISSTDGFVSIVQREVNNITLLGKLPLQQPIQSVVSSADGRTLAILQKGGMSVYLLNVPALLKQWEQFGLDIKWRPGTLWKEERRAPNIPVGKSGQGLWSIVYRDAWWSEQVAGLITNSLNENFMGESPHPNAPKEQFSLVNLGYLTPKLEGRYQFKSHADDWVSFSLNDFIATCNGKLIELWSPKLERELELQATSYPVRLEYAENTGAASYQIMWRKLGANGFDWRPIDPDCLSLQPR